MKFDMGAQTLSQLSKQTSASSQDLGALVRQLGEAAEPLQGRFHGQGRVAFDRFKARTDEIAVSLNMALSAVLGGIQGQEHAFGHGDAQMADASSQVQASIDFDAAKFSAR